MISTFRIDNANYKSLKNFIRLNLPSARFVYNPYLVNGMWVISLDISVEDDNRLSMYILTITNNLDNSKNESKGFKYYLSKLFNIF